MEDRRLRSLQSIELETYFTPKTALSLLPRYKVLAVTSSSAVSWLQALVSGISGIRLICATKDQESALRPSNVSVLLVLIEQEDDLEFGVQAANEFLYCSQKYVFGKGIEEGSKLESQAKELAKTISGEYLSGQKFTQGDQLLAQFQIQDEEIINLVTHLFHEFDRDASGYIDILEIREMGVRLGQALSDEDLNIIMHDIDVDGDGKISLEEFGMWWRSGRKGRSKQMKKLANTVANLEGFFEKYGEVFRTVSGAGISLTKTEWDLTISNVEEIAAPGISVKGQLSINKPKPELASQLQAFADFPVMATFTFPLLPTSNASSSVLALTEAFKAPGVKTLCSVADQKLVLGFIMIAKLEEGKSQYEQVLGKALASAPVEQKLSFELKIAKSPAQMAEQAKRWPLEQVLDGLWVRVKCQLWSFYHALLKMLIGKMDKNIQPFFQLLMVSSVHTTLQLNPLSLLSASVLRSLSVRLVGAMEEKNPARDGKFINKSMQLLHETVSTSEVQVFVRFFDFMIDASIEADGLGAVLTQKRATLD